MAVGKNEHRQKREDVIAKAEERGWKLAQVGRGERDDKQQVPEFSRENQFSKVEDGR